MDVISICAIIFGSLLLIFVLLCIWTARQENVYDKKRLTDGWTTEINEAATSLDDTNDRSSLSTDRSPISAQTSRQIRAPMTVDVGVNYDTAASLLADGSFHGGAGAAFVAIPEDDDAASLNGDEHEYADSNPPTEEEMRERAEAVARAEAAEARALQENKLIVQAMLRCAGELRCRSDGKAADEECAICLEELGPLDTYRRLPCNHLFHTDCIDPWLENQVTCPMCACSLVDLASPLDLMAAKETVDINRAAIKGNANEAQLGTAQATRRNSRRKSTEL